MVAHFHLGCDTGGLEFMEDDPATHFVEQNRLDTTMKGIDPRLVILRRAPDGDDVVAVLKEAHLRTDRVVRTTAETIVSRRMRPRIDNSFHDCYIYCVIAGSYPRLL